MAMGSVGVVTKRKIGDVNDNRTASWKSDSGVDNRGLVQESDAAVAAVET